MTTIDSWTGKESKPTTNSEEISSKLVELGQEWKTELNDLLFEYSQWNGHGCPPDIESFISSLLISEREKEGQLGYNRGYADCARQFIKDKKVECTHEWEKHECKKCGIDGNYSQLCGSRYCRCTQ